MQKTISGLPMHGLPDVDADVTNPPRWIFFAYYPARRASHLDPIAALRYE